MNPAKNKTAYISQHPKHLTEVEQHDQNRIRTNCIQVRHGVRFTLKPSNLLTAISGVTLYMDKYQVGYA